MTRALPDSPLLEVRDLVVERPAASPWQGRQRRAVDGVSFRLERGEVLGLVGESGAGKTSLAHAILGLVPARGQVIFDGVDRSGMRGAARRRLARRMQLVLQDPARSLDPLLTIEHIVGEGLRLHQGLGGALLRRRVQECLDLVGLPATLLSRHPHECSGGQRQRVALARALAVGAELLVLDEPVSALDLSVQARILCLLRDLQARLGLSLLFVSHDLRVVGALCERVLVMQHGRLVEEGPAQEVLGQPTHPHTQALLASLPRGARDP